MTEWFTCPSCGLVFGDPYAEQHDGVIYGKCECGHMCEKDAELVADGGQSNVGTEYAEGDQVEILIDAEVIEVYPDESALVDADGVEILVETMEIL